MTVYFFLLWRFIYKKSLGFIWLKEPHPLISPFEELKAKVSGQRAIEIQLFCVFGVVGRKIIQKTKATERFIISVGLLPKGFILLRLPIHLKSEVLIIDEIGKNPALSRLIFFLFQRLIYVLCDGKPVVKIPLITIMNHRFFM